MSVTERLRLGTTELSTPLPFSRSLGSPSFVKQWELYLFRGLERSKNGCRAKTTRDWKRLGQKSSAEDRPTNIPGRTHEVCVVRTTPLPVAVTLLTTAATLVGRAFVVPDTGLGGTVFGCESLSPGFWFLLTPKNPVCTGRV